MKRTVFFSVEISKRVLVLPIFVKKNQRGRNVYALYNHEQFLFDMIYYSYCFIWFDLILEIKTTPLRTPTPMSATATVGLTCSCVAGTAG